MLAHGEMETQPSPAQPADDHSSAQRGRFPPTETEQGATLAVAAEVLCNSHGEDLLRSQQHTLRRDIGTRPGTRRRLQRRRKHRPYHAESSTNDAKATTVHPALPGRTDLLAESSDGRGVPRCCCCCYGANCEGRSSCPRCDARLRRRRRTRRDVTRWIGAVAGDRRICVFSGEVLRSGSSTAHGNLERGNESVGWLY